jgi:mannose/fructose-specific phosphotransferase system component IIA
MARVPALLVMHGDLAAALVRAAATVYGPVDEVDVLSNEGLSREALEREIAARVAQWPNGGLVLTDLWGGSCHTCGLSAARGREIAVVAGVNLPTLVDFLHNRDGYAVLELAQRLQKKGQESIRFQRVPS